MNNARPEAQQTQDIASETCIISASKMDNESSFSTFSLCPLLGDHLSHLVLLVHHHLNDNHHLSNGPTTYFVANMITAPNSLQLLHHLADPIGDLIAHIGHLPTSLLLHHHLNDDHQLSIISWYWVGIHKGQEGE